MGTRFETLDLYAKLEYPIEVRKLLKGHRRCFKGRGTEHIGDEGRKGNNGTGRVKWDQGWEGRVEMVL